MREVRFELKTVRLKVVMEITAHKLTCVTIRVRGPYQQRGTPAARDASYRAKLHLRRKVKHIKMKSYNFIQKKPTSLACSRRGGGRVGVKGNPTFDCDEASCIDRANSKPLAVKWPIELPIDASVTFPLFAAMPVIRRQQPAMKLVSELSSCLAAGLAISTAITYGRSDSLSYF